MGAPMAGHLLDAVDKGGDDAGPTPVDLVLAALGA